MAYPYHTPFGKGLTQSQMEDNATYFANIMRNRGWSDNAIAAVFGNWQSECKLNTNYPEKKRNQVEQYPVAKSPGFGLPQWTPWYYKYGKWCEANNIQNVASDDNPAADIIHQLDYHDYECINGYITAGGEHSPTWLNRQGYNYTWENFKKSTDSVNELAQAYYWQYERSDAQSVGKRGEQAIKWYNFLQGVSPDPNPPAPPEYTNYLQIVFDNLEILKTNVESYRIKPGEKVAVSSTWAQYNWPELYISAREGTEIHLEIIPTEFYYIYWEYNTQTIETITGSYTITTKTGTRTYIGKYLKSTKPYTIDGYGNIIGTLQTKNYATFNSIVLDGVITDGYYSTDVNGYYSGSNNGLTVTDDYARVLISAINNRKRKSKAYIYALKRRYPING